MVTSLICLIHTWVCLSGVVSSPVWTRVNAETVHRHLSCCVRFGFFDVSVNEVSAVSSPHRLECRRRVVALTFIFKLVNGQINCPCLLERISCSIIPNTRQNRLFVILQLLDVVETTFSTYVSRGCCDLATTSAYTSISLPLAWGWSSELLWAPILTCLSWSEVLFTPPRVFCTNMYIICYVTHRNGHFYGIVLVYYWFM